jgi:rubrerythrin
MNVKINDDVSVDLKYLGYSDNLTQGQRATETEAAINMVAKTIETIYSGEETFACKDAPFKEVVAFVESLNNDQFASVIKFMQDSPVITYDIKYKCRECGTDNVKTLKGLSDFFS